MHAFHAVCSKIVVQNNQSIGNAVELLWAKVIHLYRYTWYYIVWPPAWTFTYTVCIAFGFVEALLLVYHCLPQWLKMHVLAVHVSCMMHCVISKPVRSGFSQNEVYHGQPQREVYKTTPRLASSGACAHSCTLDVYRLTTDGLIEVLNICNNLREHSRLFAPRSAGFIAKAARVNNCPDQPSRLWPSYIDEIWTSRDMTSPIVRVMRGYSHNLTRDI